jgi:cytochrome b6-f complex iron-sulfur subunit
MEGCLRGEWRLRFLVAMDPSYKKRVHLGQSRKVIGLCCPGGTMTEKDLGTESKSEKSISRRDLLKVLAASGGVVAIGSWLSACAPNAPAPTVGQGSPGSVALDLSQPANQALANEGGAVELEGNALDASGVLVYRASATSVIVFSRKCTHQGCTISEFQNGVASCPCHGSQFDASGQPVRGPASRPLNRYQASIQGTQVIISNAS